MIRLTSKIQLLFAENAYSMKPISLAASRRSLTYTAALTLQEFLGLDATYGELLQRRLKEVRLTSEQQLRLNRYPDTLHFLVLLSIDDPDTVAVLPLLALIAAASPRIGLHILTDEDDLTLLDGLVDDLDLSSDLDDIDLPMLFILDEEWNVQETWGPRPEGAEARLEEWLETHPEYESLADDESDEGQDAYAQLLDELTYTMRVWYNSGLNAACVDEILTLLDAIGSDEDGNEEEDNEDSNGSDTGEDESKQA
mgnify:CR=1 FL=1